MGPDLSECSSGDVRGRGAKAAFASVENAVYLWTGSYRWLHVPTTPILHQNVRGADTVHAAGNALECSFPVLWSDENEENGNRMADYHIRRFGGAIHTHVFQLPTNMKVKRKRKKKKKEEEK